MKKILKNVVLIGGTSILSLSLTTPPILAASNKPTINFNGVVPYTSPEGTKVENGNVLVPIEWISKQLGATTTWNQKNNVVEVQVPEKKELESQINSFINALKPCKSKEAVELWLNGVKKRSGSLQYASMSPELQKQTYKEFAKTFWATGGSSPKIENEKIVKEEQVSKTKVKYFLEYDLKSSAGIEGKGNRIVTVEKDPKSEFWFVTEITTSDTNDPLTPGVTVNIDSTTKNNISINDPYIKVLNVSEVNEEFRGEYREFLQSKNAREKLGNFINRVFPECKNPTVTFATKYGTPYEKWSFGLKTDNRGISLTFLPDSETTDNISTTFDPATLGSGSTSDDQVKDTATKYVEKLLSERANDFKFDHIRSDINKQWSEKEKREMSYQVKYAVFQDTINPEQGIYVSIVDATGEFHSLAFNSWKVLSNW